ncbi:Uncharacterized membrane protein YgdD, TMEM256/DUF423 family [Paenibacillus sp. 1_12]|uniref:DUF423 domain-containing protein n=1 Tax=Paenibacillus sp. 1_12 TaxID=1566278 RepID=UPI0008E598BB|nr:DUF423 domain-containing protein [Paenibacillus sp. 1_12]SFL53362.1 Uncharacterized membrane protein YgdD, TMEM256/DUF423 family [Paenibacillus sp. 1_12]
MQTLLLLGSFNMLISIILGAFGAHALKKKITADMAAVYQTAVQYQIAHGLALILLGIISNGILKSQLVHTAGWLLFVGIILFSGSLYVLSITGIKKLGAITPIGGLAFIAGWLLLIVAIIQG